MPPAQVLADALRAAEAEFRAAQLALHMGETGAQERYASALQRYQALERQAALLLFSPHRPGTA